MSGNHEQEHEEEDMREGVHEHGHHPERRHSHENNHQQQEPHLVAASHQSQSHIASRPSLSQQKRHSSTSSRVSSSLSEASISTGHHHVGRTNSSQLLNVHHHHGAHKRHVVGHGRLGNRNTSFKNLNKLTKPGNTTTTSSAAAAAMPHDGSSGTESLATTLVTPSSTSVKESRRKSGEILAGAQSPRPGALKRNASAFVVPRNTSHSALKKNFSSGHLAGHKSHGSKSAGGAHHHQARAARPVLHRAKSSGKSSGRSAPASPTSPALQAHPTVRFALGEQAANRDDDEEEEEEEEDNEWTEESASVSPNLTRDHTRQNSIILDPHADAHHDITSGEESTKSTNTVIHAPKTDTPAGASAGRQTEAESDGVALSGATLASEAIYAHDTQPTQQQQQQQQQQSRYGPDLDAITSRLLQRRAPSAQGAEPQVSQVSATVHSDSLDPRSLSQSQGSTLGSTPGRNLVSRFVNIDSTDGTPRDDDLLTSQEITRQNGEMDLSKRNRSAPNFAERGPMSPVVAGAPKSRRMRTGTPSELPPSRTQQKLLLQRASSTIEPHKHIPAVLPRPGASQVLGHGVSFDGGMPAIQGLFTQINKEYQVIRRYRSPVGDAVVRQKGFPRAESSSRQAFADRQEPSHARQNDHQTNGAATNRHHNDRQNRLRGPTRSSKSLHNYNHFKPESSITVMKREERGHKSRVSFDLPSARTEDSDDDDDNQSGREGNFGGASGSRPSHSEAYEICRRLWDMGGEAAEVGG